MRKPTKKAGRPPFYDAKMQRRTYQLTPGNIRKIENAARLWGMSQSAALRRMIGDF